MTRLLLVLVLIANAMPAVARGDPLSSRAPEKPFCEVIPPLADSEVIRQGGDTIEDATVIVTIPYNDVGTTSGYFDDYDEVCPYDNSTSPDVVYTFTPLCDVAANIDLCGSAYDTKLYVYDDGMNLVACNDDYYNGYPCGSYVSALFGVPMNDGMEYFIIIDGYGGDFGDYILSVDEYAPCLLECPPEGFPEGEPDLVDGYVDFYNGGCEVEGWPFQNLNFGPSYLDFCGVAGWYLFEGSNRRDADWFTAVIGATGLIEITADAESGTYVYDLDVFTPCMWSVNQELLVGPCLPGTLTIIADPGMIAAIRVCSSDFTNPGDVEGNMYDYILTIDGLAGTAATTTTWSQVKGLYR